VNALTSPALGHAAFTGVVLMALMAHVAGPRPAMLAVPQNVVAHGGLPFGLMPLTLALKAV
jgi:hypothetical protein